MLTDSTTVVATTIYDHSGTFYLAVLQTVANEHVFNYLIAKLGCWTSSLHTVGIIIYIALFEELIMYCDLIQDHNFANFLFYIQSR